MSVELSASSNPPPDPGSSAFGGSNAAHRSAGEAAGQLPVRQLSQPDLATGPRVDSSHDRRTVDMMQNARLSLGRARLQSIPHFDPPNSAPRPEEPVNLQM